jgi:hypothetical protein
MRDIRGDLKDRAEALEREIKAAQGRFDELMVRLKEEHDLRLNDLKSELDAVKLLIGLEHRLLGTGAPKANGAPQSNGMPQGNGVPQVNVVPQGSGVPQAKPQAQAEVSRPQAQVEPSRPQAQAQRPRPPQQDMALRRAV